MDYLLSFLTKYPAFTVELPVITRQISLSARVATVLGIQPPAARRERGRELFFRDPRYPCMAAD
eukprot:2443375-Pleurochrysis_carterae.AAC.1